MGHTGSRSGCGGVDVTEMGYQFALLKPSVVVITDMASDLLPFVQSKLSA